MALYICMCMWPKTGGRRIRATKRPIRRDERFRISNVFVNLNRLVQTQKVQILTDLLNRLRTQQICKENVQVDEKLAHGFDRQRRAVSIESEREPSRDHLVLAPEHDHQSRRRSHAVASQLGSAASQRMYTLNYKKNLTLNAHYIIKLLNPKTHFTKKSYRIWQIDGQILSHSLSERLLELELRLSAHQRLAHSRQSQSHVLASTTLEVAALLVARHEESMVRWHVPGRFERWRPRHD